jgi:FHA domain
VSVVCPAGHDSTETDYCSTCGAPMVQGAPNSRGIKGTSATGAAACPACSEPRAAPDARFCEVCRYDFVRGEPARAAATPPKETLPAAGAKVGATAAAEAYTLVVKVDSSLDVEPNADQPCPTGTADVVVVVDRDELLVGRRDDLRDIKPDIPLADPGTSRRHAKFVRAASGAITFVDLASTNGSKVNGVDVAPGSRSPLHVGDEVTLGRWTRIVVARRS